MPSFIKRASQKAMKYQEPAEEKGQDLARLVKGNEQLLSRILTRKADSHGNAGRNISCKIPGSVPFLWENEPGKPKTAEELEARKPTKEEREAEASGKFFPLNLPPTRRSSSQTLSRAASSSLLQAPKSLSHQMTSYLNSEGNHLENCIGYSEIFSCRQTSSARNSFKNPEVDSNGGLTHDGNENLQARDAKLHSRKSYNEGRHPDNLINSSSSARSSFKDSDIDFNLDFGHVTAETLSEKDANLYSRKSCKDRRQPENCSSSFSARNSFSGSQLDFNPDFGNIHAENILARDTKHCFIKSDLNDEAKKSENCIGYSEIFSSCSTSSTRNSYKDTIIDFSPDFSTVHGNSFRARDRNQRSRNIRGTFDGVSDDFTSLCGSESPESDQSSGSSSPISFSSFSSSSVISEDMPSLSSCSSRNSSIFMNFAYAKPDTSEDSTDEAIGADSSSGRALEKPGTYNGKCSRSSSGPLGDAKSVHPSDKLLQTYQRKISRKTSSFPDNDESNSRSPMEHSKHGNGLQKRQNSLNNLACNRQDVGVGQDGEHHKDLIYPKRGNMPLASENINAKSIKKDGYCDNSISTMPQKGPPFLRSQEISNMLLRLAKAEEELRFHGYDLDDDNLVRPSCLPICSFMGRNMMNQAKYLC